jgi:transposase-like protein
MASELVCPRCHGTHCVGNGSSRGHRRWRCRDCGRTFAATVGTPLFHLHKPLAEIVRAIQIVLRRGSLRAAEEQTGHNYETIATWIRRIGAHAEAVTDVLVRDLKLSEVELDEFWSFVGKKGDLPRRRGQPFLARPSKASGGAA